MEIVAPCSEDWEKFLGLAAREGWKVSEGELRLLDGGLGGSAFVLRSRAGFCGFVTATAHGRSGWIGNLLVPPDCRGKGYGSLLFEHAVEVLERQGVDSIWLTASKAGRPIYEKRGFEPVNRVRRWRHPARGQETYRPLTGGCCADLVQADSRVWGEARSRMLEALAGDGLVLRMDENLALLQGGRGFWVLGPWVSPELCPRGNRRLLAAVMEQIPSGAEVVADVLETSGMGSLLTAAGFEPAGVCELMAKGGTDRVNLGGLVSLASLGSIG